MRYKFLLPLFFMACTPTLHDPVTRAYIAQLEPTTEPLQVDFVSPQGTVDDAKVLIVHFSQAMVGPDDLGRAVQNVPVTITPRPPGEFRWETTATLVYHLKGTLDGGSDFRLRVHAGRPSLLGNALLKDVAFRFATPEPRVLSVTPDPAKRIRLAQVFEIVMNQPVDPEQAGRHIKLEVAGVDQAVEISCAPADETACDRLNINPRVNLPPGVTVFLKIAKGIQALKGKKSSLSDVSFSFHTPPALAISDVVVPKNAHALVHLILNSTTPLLAKDLANHLSFDPPLKSEIHLPPASPDSEHTGFYAELTPSTDYTLTIAKGARDIYGQILAKQHQLSFRTGHLASAINLPDAGMRWISADDTHDFGFAGVNLDQVRADVSADLSDSDVIALLEDPERTLEVFYARTDFWTEHSFTGKLNDRMQRFPVAFVLPDPGVGIVLTNTWSGDVVNGTGTGRRGPVNYWLLRQITRLMLEARLGRNRGLVWIRTRDGKPLPNAKVSLYDATGRLLAKAVSQADGLALLPGVPTLFKQADVKARKGFKIYIFARAGPDRVFLPVEVSSLVDLSSGTAGTAAILSSVFTDRDIYPPGAEVRIKGYARGFVGGWQPYRLPVEMEILAPQGETVFNLRLIPSERGNLEAVYTLPDTAAKGIYHVRLTRCGTVDSCASSSSFRVGETTQGATLPELFSPPAAPSGVVVAQIPDPAGSSNSLSYPLEEVVLTPDKDRYLAGDTAKLTPEASSSPPAVLVTYERGADILNHQVMLPNRADKILQWRLTGEDFPSFSVRAQAGGAKTQLTLEHPGRPLVIQLTPDKKIYRPGDAVTLAISVDGIKSGQGAELTLWALPENGGDPVYYNGQLQTDAKGRAVVGFVLPKKNAIYPLRPLASGTRLLDSKPRSLLRNLGSRASPGVQTIYRIHAIASASPFSFGRVTAEISAAKDFEISATTPTAITPGDEFGIAIHIQANLKKRVQLSVTGPGMSCNGDGYEVDPQKTHSAYVLCKTDSKHPTADTLLATLTAKDENGEGESIDLTIPQRRPLPDAVFVRTGMITGDVTELFEKISADLTGQLEVRVGLGPWVTLKAWCDSLLARPAPDLADQLLKATLLARFHDEKDFFARPYDDVVVREEFLAATIKRLNDHRLASGGYTVLPGSLRFDLDFTRTAARFLSLLSQGGDDASGHKEALKQWGRDLLKRPLAGQTPSDAAAGARGRLLALEVMSWLGAAETADESGLVAFWDLLEIADQARLVALISRHERPHPLLKRWLSALGETWSMANEAASLEILSALVLVSPEHAIIKRESKRLFELQASDSIVLSLRALTARSLLLSQEEFVLNQGPGAAVELSFNKTIVMQATLTEARNQDFLIIPAHKLPDKLRLVLKAQGAGPVYYSIRHTQATPSGMHWLKERGVSLWRALETTSAQRITSGALHAGTDYRLVYRFFVEQATGALIFEQDLPAAFLPVEPLQGDVMKPPFSTVVADGKVRLSWETLPRGYYELVVPVTATLPGRYEFPAARIHSPHDDTVDGESSAGRIVIE